MDAPSQAERANRLASFLGLGKAELAFPFALLLQFHPPKEVLVGPVQVSESFLHRTLRDSIHPGIVRLFEGIEFFVQIKSSRTFAGGPVDLFGPSQTPI